jgi:hypothetical protein
MLVVMPQAAAVETRAMCEATEALPMSTVRPTQPVRS